MANDAAKVCRQGKDYLGLNLKHADDVISAHEAAVITCRKLASDDWMSIIMEKPDTPNDGAGYD